MKMVIAGMMFMAAVAFGDNVTTYQEAGTPYVDRGATAWDNLDGDLTAKITTTGADQVNANALGSYLVVYNHGVVDSSGNVADPATRTVVVRDTTAPKLVLNGPATVTVALGSAYADPGASATDSFDKAPSQSSSPPLADILRTLGTKTRTYKAVDDSGNAAVPVTRTFIVVPDAVKPVITIRP